MAWGCTCHPCWESGCPVLLSLKSLIGNYGHVARMVDLCLKMKLWLLIILSSEVTDAHSLEAASAQCLVCKQAV